MEMSAYQRLASAALVAAVALVAAACGSTPGAAPAPPANPTTAPPANTATNSPASPAPESVSGTAPQETSLYPYDPGGVTFNGGLAGGSLRFSIPAGSYSLNVQASYDSVNDADGSGQCLFSGELDYPGGGSAPLGGGAPVISSFPFVLGPLVGSYGGDYKIYIYPETTCSWTVELWPNG
jgi:hypothetical protein